MPASTAAMVTKACSPAARLPIFTGTVRRLRGFAISGAASETSRVRAARSMPNQATPMAREGMRLAATSIGLSRLAST